ncbi:PAB-dependent poly(A)-specific ribonuclease subunit 3 [Podospora bellae-mahoneyi]|uniref:PAN2-PAN3 deadenylation complex subunit PAN3 n=1 Tax=Podospora bellae-mahoneyi TaxID=2093777 RepID=A0ABR0G1Q1_9PEZI|nr:PAB-dependent poly(A)-specific ribonuclease subunit 3 [Podospora bellae-mahoneyi]
MAASRYNSNDLRRQVGSPRSKGRDTKDTLCRNVVIYGHCRYMDTTCNFNHDQNKPASGPSDFLSKKSFNADSPSFTPSGQNLGQAKKTTLSSQAANAAPFTPRGVTASTQQNADLTMFNPAGAREFTPSGNTQNYELGNSNMGNGAAQDNGVFSDPFAMNSMAPALANNAPFNPYAGDPSAVSGAGAGFYSSGGAYASVPMQQPNYHLYQPYDAYRGELQPWQRSTYDYFIPAAMREEIQKKMFATQHTMPGLPKLENYHSLFSLDTSHRKNTACFGYHSWVYKAQKVTTGLHYVLRRLEGYRLSNDQSVMSVMRDWKNVRHENIVSFHETFTSQNFGDSSLIFVYDWHPLAKTLAEQHFSSPLGNNRQRYPAVPEGILWSYVCQIASALYYLHNKNLAARCLDLSKILVTEKSRIRLGSCAILDVVQYDHNLPIQELQGEDLVKFAKVILCLATGMPPNLLQSSNTKAALDSLVKYSRSLRDALQFLLSPVAPNGQPHTIAHFLTMIAPQLAQQANNTLRENDEQQYWLAREIENGRIARNVMKLSAILERGDLGSQSNWSEVGDRFQLKLFRDYVFHRVDASGKPDLGLGHMLSCMSKLDAGVDEQIMLTSRDNETVFVITYRELRGMFERAFNELMKFSKSPGL